MGIHSVQVTIENNLPAGKLQYSMEISRKNSSGTVETALPNTGKLPLQGTKTSTHQTVNLLRQTQVNFILTLTLYAVTGNQQVATLRTFKKIISFPNESSSNKDIKFKYKVKQFSCDETHQNIQTCVTPLLEKSRPYLDPQYPFGSVGDPYRKDYIDREINQRLAKLTLPDQGGTRLCGPAAFWYCLLQDQPDIYAQAARDLWQYGETKIGDLAIKPSNANKKESRNIAQYNINGLDWMTLAGLRDAENSGLNHITDNGALSNYTPPSDEKSWFKKVGATIIDSFGGGKINLIGVQLPVSSKAIDMANKYAGSANYHVLTLIKDHILQDSASNEEEHMNYHWIVWKSPLTIDINASPSLDFFSWGRNYTQIDGLKKTFSLEAIKKQIYGVTIVGKIP